MKDDITLHTRREFLRRTVLGGALSWTVPTFLANTFAALQAEAADRATQTATGRDSTILVILQMAGGNDGLNTVVPASNDYYHRARPRIGLAESKVLRLNGEVGLHPSLTGFKDLYDAGRLTVVQGVGYPNPNRSHFRSTEIWQTATDSSRVERYGWLGRSSITPAQAATRRSGFPLAGRRRRLSLLRSPPASAWRTPRTTVSWPGARPGPAR